MVCIFYKFGNLKIVFNFNFSELEKQHKNQIGDMEKLLKKTQSMAHTQSMKNKEQVEKLILSDDIIGHLISENEGLLLKLDILKNA